MVSVPPAWVAWVTENLLRGAPSDVIVEALVERGLPDDEARALLLRIQSSGELAGALKVLHRAAGVEQAARLRRTFEAQHPLEVDALDTQAFHDRYWSPHQPVVYRGAAADWPAWSLDDLRSRFGDVEIEVLKGRSLHQRWWLQREALCTRMPFEQLLDSLETTEGDDLYAVGRNDVLEDLPQLKHELGAMPGIDTNSPAARLWIGPRGTLTPLHHDQSGAWLVQRVGSKRVWLASPLEPALFDTADGVFNSTDPREPAIGDLSEVHWREVVIHPGDAVYFPAGWWHQVVAESASISVSLGGFVWPNRYTWYAPGRFSG